MLAKDYLRAYREMPPPGSPRFFSLLNRFWLVALQQDRDHLVKTPRSVPVWPTDPEDYVEAISWPGDRNILEIRRKRSGNCRYVLVLPANQRDWAGLSDSHCQAVFLSLREIQIDRAI